MTNPIPEQDQSSTTCPDIRDSWANIPDELRDRPQWLAWHGDKAPIGSSTDPKTWKTFQSALLAAATSGNRGLGFVFSADDPYVGIDLDHCLDPETGEIVGPEAQTVVDRFPEAYKERSVGGDGLHLILRAKMPEGVLGKKQAAVEVYGGARFLIFTGWEGCGDLGKAAPGAIDQTLHEFCKWDGKPTPEPASVGAFQMVADPQPPGKLFSFLDMDAKLKATMTGKRTIREDDSATEASLAALVADYGLSDQEIVDTCRWWRTEHSTKPEKAKERRLYGYLLALVKRDAAEERGITRLVELGTPGAVDIPTAERELDTRVALNEVLGLAPETGVEALWRFEGDPVTYAIKAVGRPPKSLGTSAALATCAPFFALIRDLFRIHKKGIKANKWDPMCQALLDAAVNMDVPNSEPEEELTAFLAEYLIDFPPVARVETTAYEQAHRVGAPLDTGSGALVNSTHVHASVPEHMRQTWRTPTAIGRTLAGLGLQKRQLFTRERKKIYWQVTQNIRYPGMNDTITCEQKTYDQPGDRGKEV